MSDRLPLVSIIVPVYNGERTIGSCIRSLLDMSYPPSKREIIIVDNNSRDDTLRIVREFPVVALVEDRIQSSYAARNAGIRKSRGEIIAFTDSDCIAHKDWVSNAVECFSDERVGCVAGRIQGYSPSNYIEEYLIRTNSLTKGSTRFPLCPDGERRLPQESLRCHRDVRGKVDFRGRRGHDVADASALGLQAGVVRRRPCLPRSSFDAERFFPAKDDLGARGSGDVQEIQPIL